MRERMERMKGDHMDAINVKDTEIAALRKSMQQQNQMLLDQKQKLQRVQQQKGADGQTAQSVDVELKREYMAMRQTYEQLNRDHEDLLVYLGHLQTQFEAAQKEIASLKEVPLRSHPESVESKSTNMDQRVTKKENDAGHDPFANAPPDLM